MKNLILITFTLLFLSACQTSIQKPSAIASKLQSYVDKNEIAGAVCLVANKDKVLFVDSVGFANKEQGLSMNQETMFWIASQTKSMTAVALMMLVDEGKISLDDSVEKYLPEFKKQMVIAEKTNGKVILKKPERPFTIRETLNHTSGMVFRSGVEYPTLDGINLATKIRSYAMTPLNTEPGTKYAYSNAGISTAARVLEVVSGMKYEEFMQKRLLNPLGMKDTTFWPSEEQVKKIARTYIPNKEKSNINAVDIHYLLYPLSDIHKRYPMPGGGYFSTAKDVALFCQMLLNKGQLNGKRILSERAHKELTSKQNDKSSYGLGLSTGNDWYGHGGACSTNMTIDQKDGLVLIWMVQHQGFVGKGGAAQGVFKKWALETFK